MPKKERIELAAVIDIGSSELRLKSAQFSKTRIKYLESLIYPLALGRDTFNTGKIGFDKVDKACEIIRNFMMIIHEYGITNIRVVATTAVREATNTDYFLDQVKIKTGLNIIVMDDMEEKLYIYKLLTRLLKDDVKNSALMVHIGSGNIGLSAMESGRIQFTQNIKVGSLRISELFGDIQEYSSEFYVVLEEYLHSFTDMLETVIPENNKHFVVSGTEITGASELIGASKKGVFHMIPKDKFLEFYQEIKLKTTERAAEDYRISAEKAEVLFPAMCIFHNLLRFTQAEKIIASEVTLSDAILYEMLCPQEFAAINKDFGKNTLLSAMALAKKCDAMESHYKQVENFAVKIFDKMKKLHGLGPREKLLLQTAAILHDIGKFINLSHHYRHSYDMITGSDITGLNQLETEIVANLAMYHAHRAPGPLDNNYTKLDLSTRVLVSKLTAILRIADALDRGHTQKFSEIDVRITDEELMVIISTNENIDLEQWSFKDKGAFFEEVFGIKAVIRQKKVM
ncbi:MAG: HD domain-containing protein [Clostridiales bacterium]|jgi:exopolyphosphatase/guanosine-5'-triphosphate,3'-diphosphate pyrophosphatase|nr:HD domain-containing protein [Clostridiales bacterium]